MTRTKKPPAKAPTNVVPLRAKPPVRHANDGPLPAFQREPTKAQALVDFLAAGLFLSTAADAVRWPRRTVNSWIQRGRLSVEAEYAYAESPDPDHPWVADEPYHSYYLRIAEARAKAEATAIRNVRMAGQDDWRAEAWFLARAFPERWGDRVTVAGDADRPVTVRSSDAPDLWTVEDRLRLVADALVDAGYHEARKIIETTTVDTEPPADT